MNIKEFIGKYKIIIVLVVMIVILAFVKSYFGNIIDNKNSIKTSQITTTLNQINSSTSSITKTQNSPSITEAVEFSDKEDNSQTKDLIISNEKTDNRRNLLVEKGRTYQTEKEYDEWFETLSFEDQELLLGYRILPISQLNNDLPYEGDTFIVEKLISNNVLQVKPKIDDLEKAELDVKNWLSSQTITSDNLVISWGE